MGSFVVLYWQLIFWPIVLVKVLLTTNSPEIITGCSLHISGSGSEILPYTVKRREPKGCCGEDHNDCVLPSPVNAFIPQKSAFNFFKALANTGYIFFSFTLGKEDDFLFKALNSEAIKKHFCMSKYK